MNKKNTRSMNINVLYIIIEVLASKYLNKTTLLLIKLPKCNEVKIVLIMYTNC